MSWKPTTDFEEEIVDLQPDHNFIFGELTDKVPEISYPRPKAHLEYAALQKKQRNQQETTLTTSQNHKLNVIAKVQRIAGTKPLGEQPTIDDWNDDEHVEQETIAMMRHFGLGPSLEEPLDEARTIPTYPIRDEMKIMRNGRKRIPIFFDEKFFKLKPRIPAAVDPCDFIEPKSTEKSSPTDSLSSETSSSNKSSDKLKGLSENSRYESALGDDNITDTPVHDDSFASASNIENVIRTQWWDNTKQRDNWRQRISNSNSPNDYQRHKNTAPTRYYTAKELYQMKRQQ